MQKHRVAQIAIATLLALGAMFFSKIYLIDGWGVLRPNVYVVMACATALMVIGSAGLYIRADWGRTASLAFFYVYLIFALFGGLAVRTLIEVLFVAAFLIALHAMKPKASAEGPSEKADVRP